MFTETEPDPTRPGMADDGALLRLSLTLDSLATGTLGILLAAGGPVLDGLLGIPVAVLVPLGLVLVVYAAELWFDVVRRPSPRNVWPVIALNMLWVSVSIVAVVADWLTLTAVGTVFVLLQAGAVTLFVALQLAGLRRVQSVS
jgi:hypothetical protein